MKYSQTVLSLAFVGMIVCAGVARADSINNLELSVDGLSGCPADSFCFHWDPSASAIGFTLPNSDGTYQSYNVSVGANLDITSLKLLISVTGLDISCASNIFVNCAVTTPYPDTTVVSLSGGRITPNQYFSLDFGCASGSCSWPGGTSGIAVWGTNVPEPGSMALILTGIGAIAAQRALWKTRS
jgi:hypothetical protein